jgi:tRNA dimethylallyltransferase
MAAANEQSRNIATLIAGPTASGKSALALALARAAGGVVVNADSMQVYGDLRILSARPDAADEAAAPHRLYGFVPAGVAFSTGAWLAAARRALAEAQDAGRPAVIVGGTGLYFRALTRGLVETPPIADAVMAEIAAIPVEGGALHRALALRDPAMAARLDPADAPRLQRALGVVLATGRSLMEWWSAANGAPVLPAGGWRGVVLDPPREALEARIARRFARMVDRGALEEAARLAAHGLAPNRGVMKAHGLPHLIDHLEGRIDLSSAVARGTLDTRRYAKRQRTFFRHQMADWTRLTGFGEEFEVGPLLATSAQ